MYSLTPCICLKCDENSRINLLQVKARQFDYTTVDDDVLLFTVKRLILLENVPTCSEAELRAEFPEALNVLDYSFDNDCPG